MTTYRLTILASFTHDVWKGEYVSDATTDEALLDEVFRSFNRVDYEDADRLERIGYNLPSLTAGDVVGIESLGDDERIRLYVCDSVGWREIEPGLGLIREEAS